MADSGPCKNDILTIFKKLRALPANKACFDCNAKNPTWSSVTYGVFICLDCSAVHRGLGVHLTFVRSTQLDTNWTWLQLRQMQLGGNANASVFFRQHNCITTDAQQKYNSRAAQLYKEKLSHAATQAMRLHGTKLFIEATQEKPEETSKEVDFFEEHSTDAVPQENDNSFFSDAALRSKEAVSTPAVNGAPSVVLSTSSVPADPERKSIIGGRKPTAKRTGLGGKKGGLGAQKVQTNFADIEREAEMMDKLKEREAAEAKAYAEKTVEEEQNQMASMRLAYKNLSMQQQKEEDRVKQVDPKKAQQVERLGMGFSAKSGVSHSALSDMKTIEQETPVSSGRGGSSKSHGLDASDDLDDYSFPSEIYSVTLLGDQELMDRMRDRSFGKDSMSKSKSGMRLTSDSFGSSFEDIPTRQERVEKVEKPRREPVSASNTPSTSEAQKKFGNAKAISSDQYFGDSNANNWERQANLSRFEGSSSISSADYFGDGSSRGHSGGMAGHGLTSSISAPDLDDVKESVRQGVTKVAGKISSLANGVLSSIQDRYGY